jgi:hypothetical protein
MKVKVSDRVNVPPDVMARSVGDEIVILDLAKGTYFGLDPVGAKIWQLLTDRKTLREICDLIVVEYDVGPEVFERDLLHLLEELVAQGLVEVIPV